MDPKPRISAALRSHTLIVHGRSTAVRLEEPFWEVFCREARGRGGSRSALAAHILESVEGRGLTARIRVYVITLTQERLARQLAKRERDYSREYRRRNGPQPAAQPAGAP